ncbi:unnamed protein product, partial [Lymnaea stagnalis]
MFLRRHHCRICGQIFCSKCCNQELPGKIIGYKGGIRVCTYCCKVVQRYAQQSASTGDYKALEDLKAISQLYSESSGRSLSPRLPSGMEDMIPPHRGESMPDLPGSVAADMNTPFDLTPQSEFSSQESLLLESKLLIQDSVQLRELWRLMSDAEAGVETQTLRIRLRTHQNCIVGKELVDWLIKYDKAATRDQAMAIGQALIYAGYLEPFSNQLPVFKDDFTLYRHGETASSFEMKGEPDSMPTISEELEKNEPLWFQEIGKSNSQDTGQQESSSLPEDQLSTLDSEGQKSISSESDNRTIFYISEGSQSGSFSEVPKIAPMKEMIEEPLPKGDYSVHGLGDDFLKGALFLGKPPMTSSDVVVSSHGWRSVEQLREENGERLAYERLKKAHTELWHILIRQMLSQHSLLLSWESVILTCITQVSHFVRPDVRLEGDEMDIRNYVHIKKVPGGNKNDTSMFHGVIFTKNIAHKKMKTKIVNPLILLMKGTIEFQRVENKFSSLEPQILQEREFMRNCVMKMIAYRPNVVVVEKSVSRLAQEYLLEAGITLLYNVKQSVMERLARFTQADIVSSIDGLVRKPKMGFCHDFRVQTYNLPNKESKTLAIFDGCATHLGCTIVLSGGTLGELRRVKHILKFMNYTAYNSLLELCYCMDEFALPHPGADEIALSSLIESTLPGYLSNSSNEKKDKVRHSSGVSNASTSYVSEGMSGRSTPDCAFKTGGPDDDPSAVANTFVKKKSERCVSDGIPSRATTSKLTELTDFSDPLLGYQNTQDESIFHSTNTQKIALREIKQTKYKRFRKALDGVHLSVSPYHKYSVPFMETDKGSRCAVRRYLPEEIFWSNLFDGEAGQMLSKSSKFLDSDSSSKMTNKSNIQVLEPHSLITCKLTEPIRENESQVRSKFFNIFCLKKYNNLTCLNVFSCLIKWIDCLEPLNHQRLMVLFSSYSYKSANHPYPCVYPWVVTMEFYGRNDITLGGFLERFCFKKQYACPSPTCDTPMTDHVRRFVHGNACINLLLKKLDNEVPGGKENILMWSWCRKCKQVTPVVPISNDTWSISFAKYLDLRLHSSSFLRRGSAEPCSHSLHHDHFQYFGHRNIVASFKFNTISLKELALPPCVVTLQPPTFDAAALGDMVRNITYRATNSYSVMLENTMKLKQEFTSEAQVRTISEFLVEQQFDKKCFRDAATNIQMKIQELIHSVTTAAVSGPSDCDMSFHLYSIFDNIELLKRTICEDVLKWNTRMQDFMANQQKKSRPQASKKERDSGNLVDDLEKSLKSAADRSSNKISAPPIPATSTPQPQTGGATITLPTFPASPPSMSSLSSTDDSSIVTSGEYSSKVQSATAAGKPAKIILPATAASPEVQVTEASTASLQSLPGPTTAEGQGSNVGPSPAAAVPPAGVSNPSSATEDDSTDGWFQDLKGVTRRWLSTSSFVPLSLPFDYSEHHTLPLCERVPIVVYDNEPSSIIAYALSSSDYLCRLREIHTATRRTNSDPNVTGAYTNKTTGPLGSGGEGVAETGRRSGGGMLSFLRGSSREPSPHHTSPHAPRHVMEAVRYVPGSDWGESGGHPDDVDISILSDEATPSPEEKPKVGSALPSPHIELQFSDATAKFYCRVYFAEQFRKLRKLLFLGNDNLFIRSLGRCKSWEAKGGKSGSSFCKTDDDRFILKQMSNMEVESFEKFGPQYFQYIRMCITEQQPTALAKILGVYRIGFRNTQTNNALRQDVLVMENLFYNRNISQKFDLKGSMRNRLVNTSSKRGEEELVLLDENLLKCSVESPLYLRPHSKYVLKSAITSDSTFLSTNLVMDYSLLVGVDEDTQEMVVGIIDYIRTFTWDKKLEMVVKSSGILGG